MGLASSTKLGPYEIQEALGAGGMGEVYRARDTRLQRTVAIKILPESFASDADRLERFQQEARILSALNHPNLMAIYDVGAQDGIHYLVSEFLDGQSLREVINAGPLSQRRVTEYGLQIAKGLAAAHDKGIVHRDLKPENVFILRDGQVKILDFGLAKQAVSAAASGENATLTSAHRTAAGTVLGTATYMSPEQVRGQAVDHRSDIFSLGAILHEMITGQRAFKGDSAVEVMNSILKDDPPELLESGFHVSVGLQKIVQRCLEKKPEARFQSASDLAFALDSLSTTSTPTAGVRALKEEKKSRAPILLGCAIVAVVAIATLAYWLLHRPAEARIGFTQISFRSEYIRSARIAPDGRTVVYGATATGKPMSLFSTRTDTAEAQPLNINGNILSISPESELAVQLNPWFHPLFVPIGRLARVPLGGGATREMLDGVIDADWNHDGSAIAVSRQVGSHWHLEYPIGKVLYDTIGYVSDLRFSPKGDKIAFIDHSILGDDRGFVDVIDLQANRKALTPEFASVQGLAWSPSGDEVWFTGSSTGEGMSLRAVDLDGHQRVLLPSPTRIHLHDVGKDGVLLSTEDFRWEGFLVDKATGQTRDVTSFPWQEASYISRDGQMVLINAYITSADTNYYLYVQRADGSAPVLIGEGAALGFSFDDKWVAALDPAKLTEIKIIPTGVGGVRTVNAPKGTQYLGATWMPDGKHLLVVAAAAGHAPATYIQDLTTGAARQITPEGTYIVMRGDVPVGVSPDGKFCLTIDGEGRRWIQPINGGPAKQIQDLEEHVSILEWHNDSENLFIYQDTDGGGAIYNLNIPTGKRTLWTQYSPSDKAAVIALNTVAITPDGEHYVYGVPRVYSTLYMANGIH